ATTGDRLSRDHCRWAVLARADLLPRQLRLLAGGHDRRSAVRPGHAGSIRCSDRTRLCHEMTTVYVPRDAGALSVGAGAVAEAIAVEAKRRGIALTVMRNGSRGAYFLEPLVEVQTTRGRCAYGPVQVADVPSLFAADFLNG